MADGSPSFLATGYQVVSHSRNPLSALRQTLVILGIFKFTTLLEENSGFGLAFEELVSTR
jgi:hypothetical protein